MSTQVRLPSSSQAPDLGRVRGDRIHPVLPDIAYKRLGLVNIVFYGAPSAGDRAWVLIDAGLPGTAGLIARSAATRFGKTSRPFAIIMTHAHFDHVGALKKLADEWDCPIFAHDLELPFLNGSQSYSPPDPGVGGGLMSRLSVLYPRGPVDVSKRLQRLPERAVPGMPGWDWVPTPGHSPGHISLWRASDRTLISGDAVITTNQESAYSVAVQSREIHGPPMYYTPDWERARASVRRLAELEPELLVSGHGRAMRGPEMRSALHLLAKDFDQIARPNSGVYSEKAYAA